LIFKSRLRGIRHCTLWLLRVGTLEGHRPFAKIADKRKISAANQGVRWQQNGEMNYQKDDKFYFEMGRIVQGMLGVIFYNNQSNRIPNWCSLTLYIPQWSFCNINILNNITHSGR
jgi:hypothetical protein